MSACFCQRIADHKCLPTISIATKANQTSSGCSWEEGLLLWQWRQRDVVPFVQAWIKSRAISVVIISEHQKPWFLRWGFWVSLQESGRVYQIVPSFTHTAKPEETCYWQASQDSFYKMLWKIAPNVCSHYNLIGIASHTSIFTVHHFDLVIAMGGTATSSQKGLYWTRRSYYNLLKCRVLPVVVVAAIAAQEEHWKLQSHVCST